jgi:hypothetical protein
MILPTNYSGTIHPGTIPEKGLWSTLADGTPHIMYAPHLKQSYFHESDVTNLLAVGSRNSGKSLMLRFDAHMRCLSVPGASVILIRKTMKQLEQSHLLDIRREMELLKGEYHGTNHVATYPNGSKLFFSYVGNEGDALNLLSAEFLAAYYDELSVIPWEYFMKLNASVRVPRSFSDRGIKAVVRGATNPLGVSASECMQYFVNQDFSDEEMQDLGYIPGQWGHVRIDMEDNPAIDLVTYRRQLSSLPPHLKAAWLHGEYMETNTLFDFKPTKDGKPYHVLNELDLEEVVKKARIYRVYDHGYAPDPAYCAWIAHLGNRYIVIHEQTWMRTVVSDIATNIKEIDEELGISKIVTTYCDPTIDIHTGADVRTIKDIFEQHGVYMECSINNREHFASVVHTALAEEAEPDIPRLQILRAGGLVAPGRINPVGNGAPYLAKAIPQQRWDEKHPLRLANQANDHPVVSLAYFLFSHSSESQRTFEDRITPKWMRPKKNTRWVLGASNVRGS